MGEYEELVLPLRDGYPAYARFWSVPRPRGAVLYLHGIQSHCGWYEESARHLQRAGLAVLQPDRRGSGKNLQARGHADGAEQLIEDVLIARDLLLRRTDLDRFHLLGVSWGGKLVVAACVHEARDVASLTLVTPGLFPRIGVTAAEKFRIGVAMITDPHRLFDIPLNDAELFTAQPPRQRFIESDPLTLRQATAGFYLASRRMDRICARLPEIPAIRTHLLLAEDERIIDNARTVRFVRDLKWPRTRITTYRGARHSLEFEPEARATFEDITAWLLDA